MCFMFYECNNLKYLNLSKFTINCETKAMFKFKNKKNEKNSCKVYIETSYEKSVKLFENSKNNKIS